MAAGAGNVDIPLAVLDNDADALMEHEPSDVVELAGGGGLDDGQGEVSTAESGAMITEQVGHASNTHQRRTAEAWCGL